MTDATAQAAQAAQDTPLNALRRSPAEHLAGEMAGAEVTGDRAVSLREVAFPVQVGLRVRPGSAAAAELEQTLGFALPARHGEVTGDAHAAHVLWISPDEFLYVDVSRQQRTGDAAPFEAALEGESGQALDLSANRALLELSGPSARAVLEKGCHADLHPRAFPAGRAITALLSTVQILLHRVPDGGQDTFRIYPRASFTEYTVGWLVDGMLEFAGKEVL